MSDLDTASAVFVLLGLEVEGRTFLEGDFLDTAIGMRNARVRRSCCCARRWRSRCRAGDLHPAGPRRGVPAAKATELGLRSVTFAVDDVPAIVERIAAGYSLSGSTDSGTRGRPHRGLGR